MTNDNVVKKGKEKLFLISIDYTCLTVSLLLSLFLRQSPFVVRNIGEIIYNTSSYLLSFIIASLLLICIFSAFKLYQIRQIEFSARIFTVLKALTVWVLMITALTYAFKFDFSRGVFVMTVILTMTLICLLRYTSYVYRHKTNINRTIEVVILGDGKRARDVEDRISEHLSDATIKKIDPLDKKQLEILTRRDPTDIFIADERLSRGNVLSLISDERFAHHSWRIISDTFRLVTGEVRLNDLDEIPSIRPRNKPQDYYLAIKRMFDILVSSVGLVVIAPLWLAITIAIRLDSKGPTLLRQDRIGCNGKPFTLLKFRTMHPDTLLYEQAPRDESDSRITRVGRFLRRLSLDELPQLWNILKGDMSMVGPRPEMGFIVDRYAPWQRLRLTAKPGLTGLWQILGRKNIPLHENLEYDFFYISNRSIILDLVIIAKTIPAVLFGRGAY